MTPVQYLLYLLFAACLVFAVVMVAKLQDSSSSPDGAEDDGQVIVIPQLFFSARGRIGRGEYWIGAAAILASQLLDAAVPSEGALMWISGLISLVMFYSAICLYSKRLHDLGLSGWMQVFLYVAGIVIIFIAVAQIVPQAIKVVMEHPNDQAAVQAEMKTLAKPGFMLIFAYPILKALFTVGLGLLPGQMAENDHGPAPVTAAPEYA